MSKNQIRVQYSGFIIFGSQILSVATGLAFTLLLTRNMNPSQYGIWTNIFDYTGYFALFSGILPFWATRFIAHGKEGTVKTSALVQLSAAFAATVLYFPAIILITKAIGTQAYMLTYLIAGAYIFDFYMVAILEGILRSIRPQATGYGLLIQEVIKVAIAFTLIEGFHQLFLGAILALVVSGFGHFVYYIWILRNPLREKFNWSYLKEWFKGSAVITYNIVGGYLTSFVLVLLFIYGGQDARAFYQAAFTFTNIISYSSSLAFALYPKLLSKTCQDEQVGLSFKTVMMLAIPLSTITIAMASSFLTILKIDYAVAWPVVIALTVDTLVLLVSQFYSTCLMGVEGFDAEGKIALRKLVKSKIFKVFSLTYIQAAVALPVTYFILTALPLSSSVQAAVEVSMINIGVHLGTFVGLYLYMRNSLRLPVAWISIAKYVGAAVTTGIVLYAIPAPSTLLLTVGKAVLGLAVYFALLMAMDKQARELPRRVYEEIKANLSPTTKNGNFGDENALVTGEN